MAGGGVLREVPGWEEVAGPSSLEMQRESQRGRLLWQGARGKRQEK